MHLPKCIIYCIFIQYFGGVGFRELIGEDPDLKGREMLRMGAVGAAVLCGAGLSVSQLLQHHWISAVVYVAAGVLTGLLIAFGIMESYDHPMFVVGFGIIGMLGLFAVFAEHRAFEPGRAEVLANGVAVFAQLDPLQCRLPPSRVLYLQEAGVRACAMQGIHDQMDAAQALQRAHVVPPEMTVVDGALQAFEKDNPDPCIHLLREVQRACPHALTRDLNVKLTELRR